MNETTRNKYEKFREAFLELRGRGVYIIEEKPVYKRIIEPADMTILVHYQINIMML
jgi:hypothetical protein